MKRGRRSASRKKKKKKNKQGLAETQLDALCDDSNEDFIAYGSSSTRGTSTKEPTSDKVEDNCSGFAIGANITIGDLMKDQETASKSTATRALPETDGWLPINRGGVNDNDIARDAQIAKMARQEGTQGNKKTAAAATISTSRRKKMKMNTITAKPKVAEAATKSFAATTDMEWFYQEYCDRVDRQAAEDDTKGNRKENLKKEESSDDEDIYDEVSFITNNNAEEEEEWTSSDDDGESIDDGSIHLPPRKKTNQRRRPYVANISKEAAEEELRSSRPSERTYEERANGRTPLETITNHPNEATVESRNDEDQKDIDAKLTALKNGASMNYQRMLNLLQCIQVTICTLTNIVE